MDTPIYALSDRFIEESAPLDPLTATYLGIPGYDHLFTDFSPEGHAARAEHAARTLTALDALAPTNDADRLAAGVLRNDLELSGVEFAAGEHLRSIRVIAGDLDGARMIFDMMPMETAGDWENIASRMEKFPEALAGMRASWQLGIQRGVVAPQRQVSAVAAQAESWAGDAAGGFFHQLASQASVDESLRGRLSSAADACSRALADTGRYLRNEYLAKADPRDGVGEERHAFARRRFLGMDMDAREAYDWGWDEVARLDAEIRRVGEEILPGASPAEVRHLLDTDPKRAIFGEENLRGWLQGLMDEAMAFLIDNRHFDIPASIRRVEAMISPPGGADAMYYTGPSEDLSRPGRTWYPLNGRESVPMWGEPSTAYHEGVPGHHLQVAIATVNAQKLSRYQRNTFVSGHGEGWALYAERLMDEFGFFANPDYRLGYLYAQAMRAARVVIDIGLHCGFTIPTTWSWHPGEAWTPQLALEFLTERSSSDDNFNKSEIDRYLGWPGQAISYKLGERVWLDLRDEAKRRHGSRFDLREWHAFGLDLGNLGLDLLQQEMGRFAPSAA
jgi:uncharacterized protein (DUF885 family)